MKLGSLFGKKKTSPEVEAPSWKGAAVTAGNERSNIQLGAHRNAPKKPKNLLAGIQNHAVSVNESASLKAPAAVQPMDVDIDDLLAELEADAPVKKDKRATNIQIGAHRQRG